MPQSASLVLGWQVTPSDDPQFWLSPSAKPGAQKDADLVVIPAETMATHTVIVAQSGSGKSAFLGRIVEELLLRTKARCLVLDPNSDFRQVHDIETPELWRQARFDPLTRTGKLPHEPSRTVFRTAWNKVGKKVSIGTDELLPSQREQLKLWWPSLSVEFLSEGLDPMLRGEFYHCHVFAQAVTALARLRDDPRRNPIEIVEQLHGEARRALAGQFNTEDERRAAILAVFKNSPDLGAPTKRLTRKKLREFAIVAPLRIKLSTSLLRTITDLRRTNHIERAVAALSYFSMDVAKFYFGKASEIDESGILSSRPPAWGRQPQRLHVIDMPSLKDHSTRLLAISAILETEWQQSRDDWEGALMLPPSEDTRTPTFIVVDEAHNLMPDDVPGIAEAKLREQFRTIVAEGRKFGVFLILVSQRPDKLDKRVLSECENKALMRLDSKYVLDITQEILGLQDIPTRLLEKTLGFGIGRALILGRWAGGAPKVCYPAARRTLEGGRNLRPAHWATPPELPDKAKSPKKTGRASRAKRRH